MLTAATNTTILHESLPPAPGSNACCFVSIPKTFSICVSPISKYEYVSYASFELYCKLQILDTVTTVALLFRGNYSFVSS